MRSINEKIKQVRNQLGFNQTEFGDLLGRKQSDISKFERTGHNVPLDYILQIANKFDIDMNWLIKDNQSINQSDVVGEEGQEYNSGQMGILEQIQLRIEILEKKVKSNTEEINSIKRK